MVIASVEEVSTGCVKITTSSGPSFFIRNSYLSLVKFDDIVPSAVFLEEKEDDILNAGLSFAAEKKAVDYLARAEQCRIGLVRKLTAKGFAKEPIQAALDYLESISYLSDRRFARAWLNNRKIGHSEGRGRLASELAARGISRNDADLALDEFFDANDEKTLCLRALKKCQRLKKSLEKTQDYLKKCGFSYRVIKDILSESLGNEPD